MNSKDQGRNLRYLRNQEFSLLVQTAPTQSVPFCVSPTEILLEALCQRRHEAVEDVKAFQASTANETDPSYFDELREAVVRGELAQSIDEILQCNSLIDGIAHNLSVVLRDATRSIHVEAQYEAQLRQEYMAKLEPERQQFKQDVSVFHDLQDGFLALWEEVGKNLSVDVASNYPDLLQTMLTRWQQAVELSGEERPTIAEARQVGQLISLLASLQTHYSTIEALREKAKNARDNEKAAATVATSTVDTE